MTVSASRAKRLAGGGPWLERRVRRRCPLKPSWGEWATWGLANKDRDDNGSKTTERPTKWTSLLCAPAPCLHR